MELIDVIKNLSSACLIIIASLCYCYFIASKFPKGIFRLTSVIPIFCIFINVPYHLGSTYAIFATSYSISWLCNFKLLLFSFDQGPLSCKLSLPIFMAIAALPITTKEPKYPPKKIKSPLYFCIEALLYVQLTEFLINYRGILSQKQVTLCYATFLMFFVESIIVASYWIGKLITGLDLDQPSNEPLLSTSVQEFWGRRWNIVSSNTLRSTIYLPVKKASEKVLGEGLCSTCIGVMAAFVVSGLMHELMFYHMTLMATSWEATMFFGINGVVVSMEIIWKKKVGNKLRLNSVVSCLLTIGFTTLTIGMVYIPQWIRGGVYVRLLEEIHHFVEYLKGKILD